MNDADEYDPYLPFFDLSPAAFPWTQAKIAAVGEARGLTGSLFFDELLGMAAVDASLYPPQDTLGLRHLINSTLTSEFDRLKKDCLVYYLLLDYASPQPAEMFRLERAIPARFARLSEGYWFLDNKQLENAVKCLTLPSLTPDFVPKILKTLSLYPMPTTAAQLVLKFIRFATPDLTTDDEVDIKVDALARVNFREAWEFIEGLHEGDRKQELVRRVVVATLSPKPVPAHLQLLLAFPFSSGSEQTLHALCLHPPSSLARASIKVLHDLAHTRLIAQGRLLDAIRLDRSIGSGREGEKRRETIERLVRIMPEVQRRILEVEMGGGDKDKDRSKANGAAPLDYPPAPTTAATLVAPTPIPAAFQHQQNLPLSASQVLRTSSPQLSVHRAILSPAAAPPPSPARDPSAPAKRPFSFPAPPVLSSPARSTFATANAADSPFGHRNGQGPYASTSTAAQPSHYASQRQQTASAAMASPARAQAPMAAAASPFAQAAKQASQAAYRSSLIGRDQRARQESPRSQPTYSRASSYVEKASAETEGQEDEMLVVESPPPPAAKKRASASRRTKEKPQPTAKGTRSSRRQADYEGQVEIQEESSQADDAADALPGAFPGADESTVKAPSTRRKAAPRHAAAAVASKTPSRKVSSARGKRAPSVPGSFTTGATSDESDGDELTLEDLAPPPTASRRKTRAAPPPASSSGYGLRKGHVRTRSMSVASDSGEEDELESQGKTPPPSMRKRTLRSSVTVSPEAVRRSNATPSGKAAATTRTRAGGSKLKEVSTTAAPTRRSTRRTAAGDE